MNQTSQAEQKSAAAEVALPSEAEILSRIAAIKEGDWMGTTASDLIDFLSFDAAKTYLKPETTADQWNAREVKPPLTQAREYLDFAWGKANNCRGLSAGRSLDHLKAWLWLAGYGELVDAHFDDYDHYGKFQLVIASELTGIDWRAADDGAWLRDESSSSLSGSAIAALTTRAAEIARASVAIPFAPSV